LLLYKSLTSVQTFAKGTAESAVWGCERVLTMSADEFKPGAGPDERSVQQPQGFVEPVVNLIRIEGLVKWFDVARGYGFIIPDNGLPDILLHLSCLKRDGFDAPLEGTKVTCEVVARQKGFQCLRVLAVDSSTAIHPVERQARTHAQVQPTTGWVRARVKWFNRARGFGFASEGDGLGDIFVHMEVLRKTQIAELQPDQWIYVRYGDSNRGKMASEVRFSLDTGVQLIS
jgi:cold shock protein